jgi:cytochrome c oxidase subunit IV
MNTANPTTQAKRRYVRRFSIVMTAYLVTLFATTALVDHYALQGAVRYVLLLSALVPVGFMVPIMVQYLRESDEFERRIVTESLAVAAGITAMLSVTYGFLESFVGMPRPSAWFTWVAVMGSWFVARFFVARHYGGFGCN